MKSGDAWSCDVPTCRANNSPARKRCRACNAERVDYEAEARDIQQCLILIEREARGWHWVIEKSRSTPRQPLYALAMFALNPDGTSDEKPTLIAEADDFATCAKLMAAKLTRCGTLQARGEAAK